MPTSACFRWLKRASAAALGLALLIAGSGGCRTAPADRPEVRIAGSDTMLALNRRLAEVFMRTHPGVAVEVMGGGTGSGVDALINRQVDLTAASRPFTADEIRSLHDRFETIGLRFLIARDALSVYVNPSNTVRDLSLDQLRAIFSGRITRWSDVGGPDEPIVVVLRPPSSGTYRFFREHVLKDADYSPAAMAAIRTGDVVAAVRERPGAVGYGAVIHGTDLPRVRVEGVDASVENVRTGSYPLARYLYFYATAPPEGTNKQFLDWCVGPEGQAVVADVGFVPLWIDD
jgi:phosphate transport system substrate-binding protein